MAGVPIRLVRRDGQLIHLNCENYYFEVDRTVLAVPIPITAERFGADFNMVRARIQLECILVDDECTSVDFGVSYATSTIDFSVQQAKLDGTTSGTAQSGWMSDDGGATTANFLDEAYISLIATPASAGVEGTEFKIILESVNNNTSIVGNDITVGISGDDSAAELVTRIKSALDNFPAFLAKFEVAVQAGDNANLTGNTAMVFTQKVGGSLGATAGPNLEDTSSLVVGQPKISDFTHVSDTGCRSAGDKAQNILATVANNSVLGVMGSLGSGFHDQSIDYFYGEQYSDYIVGLQLPYNSLAQGSLSEEGDPVAGYNVRNFIVITGAAKSAGEKGAASNVEEASTEFQFNNKYTGISGTVDSCKLSYEAGETVYRATIIFKPLDFLTGVG